MSYISSWNQVSVNEHDASGLEGAPVSSSPAIPVIEEELGGTAITPPTKLYDFHKELESWISGSSAFIQSSKGMDIKKLESSVEELDRCTDTSVSTPNDILLKMGQSYNFSPSWASSYECSRTDSCTSVDSIYSPNTSSVVLETTVDGWNHSMNCNSKSNVQYYKNNAYLQEQNHTYHHSQRPTDIGQGQLFMVDEIAVSAAEPEDNKEIHEFRACGATLDLSTSRVGGIDDWSSYPNSLGHTNIENLQEQAHNFHEEIQYLSSPISTAMTQNNVCNIAKEDCTHHSSLSETQWNELFSPVTASSSIATSQTQSLMDPIVLHPRPKSYQNGSTAHYLRAAEREAAKRASRKPSGSIGRRSASWSSSTDSPSLCFSSLTITTDMPNVALTNAPTISPVTPKKVSKIRTKKQSPCYILDARAPDSLGFVNYDARDGSMLMAAVAPSGNNRRKPGCRTSSF